MPSIGDSSERAQGLPRDTRSRSVVRPGCSAPLPELTCHHGVVDLRPAPPEGDPFDWYQRGNALLADGSAAAAAELLSWAVEHEPGLASVRESYARALFDSKRFEDAVREFRALTEMAPDDDYAQFGLGMSLWRQRRFSEAAEHLAMAAVMRPERAEYGNALRQVRATLAAREEAGMQPQGSAGESAL